MPVVSLLLCVNRTWGNRVFKELVVFFYLFLTQFVDCMDYVDSTSHLNGIETDWSCTYCKVFLNDTFSVTPMCQRCRVLVMGFQLNCEVVIQSVVLFELITPLQTRQFLPTAALTWILFCFFQQQILKLKNLKPPEEISFIN